MITIKDEQAQKAIAQAGLRISHILHDVKAKMVAGATALEVDSWIAEQLKKHDLISQTVGYKGYRHVSCISINDEIVHGIPSERKVLRSGDLVSVDICAAWNGYCADAARSFVVGSDTTGRAQKLIDTANTALDRGIEKAVVGGRLSDISAAIQKEVESNGFGVVRHFCGHGIGKKMHEEPEILNYGAPGRGAVLKAGMVFAIEPMITAGDYDIKIASDGWTALTVDGSLAAHVEDTVIITPAGPQIVTRQIG
jgi:methionyl aminopeptidase